MPQEFSMLKAVEIICEALSERNATLFLGAGINASIQNDLGEDFPLGKGLAEWMSRDLLKSPDFESSLEEVAEITRYRVGEETVNDYIFQRFSSFRPGTAHLSLVQLPWDTIYTTNYDLLVEQAAQSPSVTAAGSIRPVFSISGENNDLATFSENDIPYYKLHGSIDFANTPTGRLILTKDDYRDYELYRKPLFKRLARDLMSRTFVFIGYSLSDNNFRAILDDCRNELMAREFPLSFAVQRSFLPVQENFWREKYNIQLIATDGAEFLETIKQTWLGHNYAVLPFEERRSKIYLQVDQATRFPRVAESFYRIIPSDCNGASNPKLFFEGAEPSWADIRDKVPPVRDAYWTISEAIFPELAEPDIEPRFCLTLSE